MTGVRIGSCRQACCVGRNSDNHRSESSPADRSGAPVVATRQSAGNQALRRAPVAKERWPAGCCANGRVHRAPRGRVLRVSAAKQRRFISVRPPRAACTLVHAADPERLSAGRSFPLPSSDEIQRNAMIPIGLA